MNEKQNKLLKEAIKDAYFQGYNDARNNLAQPGDNCPGMRWNEVSCERSLFFSDLINDAGEDDTQLIRAAPALLAALQHVMRVIPMGGFAQIHHGSSTYEQIDAAISEAIGDPDQ